jgi:hypothetical protein
MSGEEVNERVKLAIELIKGLDKVFVEATEKIMELFLKALKKEGELAVVMFKVNGQLSVLCDEAVKMIAKAVLGDHYVDPEAGACRVPLHIASLEEKIAFVRVGDKCGLIYRDHHSGEIEYVEF